MAEQGSGQTQLRLGIDTGGTYTDAALVDAANQVIASGKSLTTHRQLEVGILQLRPVEVGILQLRPVEVGLLQLRPET